MITFSPLIIGTMRLGEWGIKMKTSEYERFIDQCLDLDLFTFDHADIYGSYTTEAEFGTVLSRRKDLRPKIQLISKCGIKMKSPNRPNHSCKSYDSSPDHIKMSVDKSLKNLNTDYLDVLLLHRPDYLMNPKAISETFQKLKEQGKVRHFGVSNFSKSQVELLSSFTEITTNQVEISLTHKEAFNNGILDQCLQKGIKATAWSPLGPDIMFSQEENTQKKRISDASLILCNKYNCSLDQLLIAWLKKHPADIIPVVGTTKIARIKAAKEALHIQISNEDWYKLYQASTGEIIP